MEDLTEAEKFLGKNPSAIYAKDGVGETVFHWFVVENKIEYVQWLLDKGSDIDNLSFSQDTPLLEAASLGYTDMCKFLLDNGANPRLMSEHGYTALGAAAISNKVEVLKLLLSRLPNSEDVNQHMDRITKTVLLEPDSESFHILKDLGLNLNT